MVRVRVKVRLAPRVRVSVSIRIRIRVRLGLGCVKSPCVNRASSFPCALTVRQPCVKRAPVLYKIAKFSYYSSLILPYRFVRISYEIILAI